MRTAPGAHSSATSSSAKTGGRSTPAIRRRLCPTNYFQPGWQGVGKKARRKERKIRAGGDSRGGLHGLKGAVGSYRLTFKTIKRNYFALE